MVVHAGTLGETAEESATARTTDTAIVCSEPASALLVYTAASVIYRVPGGHTAQAAPENVAVSKNIPAAVTPKREDVSVSRHSTGRSVRKSVVRAFSVPAVIGDVSVREECLVTPGPESVLTHVLQVFTETSVNTFAKRDTMERTVV